MLLFLLRFLGLLRRLGVGKGVNRINKPACLNRTARTNAISLGVGLNRTNRSSRRSRLKGINGIKLLSRINRITGRLGAEG
jgi:hypothetical protein